MQIKKHFLILFLLLIGYSVTSQEKQLANADEDFKKYAFIDAQQIYLKVAQKGYKSADLYKKLGDSYYFNAELGEAARWYGGLYENYKDDMGSEYLFRYAQSLKNIEDYQEADKIMEAFDKAVEPQERRAELFDNERNYLDLIEMQSGKFRLTDVGINSGFSDFAPSFRKGELVFASARSQKMSKIIHGWNEMPFLDLYSVLANSIVGSDLVDLQKVRGKVNTRFHESSTTFTKDGNTMYFTRNNFTGNKLRKDENGTSLLKLYRSTLSNGKWGTAEELSFNSDSYSVAHPALSADGTKLYFASDMPGGKGLSDLYVVDVKSDGSFGTPESLGDLINTEGRETFPYVSDSGRLYFASDGHIGLGGLDIFIAIPTLKSFEKPINVGAPVNSPNDDFTFILNEETKIGYFASNRPGGMGSDDIYSFLQEEELITRCKQTVTGEITDTTTRKPLSKAIVTLFDTNMKEITDAVTEVDGTYKFTLECNKKYIIRGAKPEYGTTEVELETDYQFEREHYKPLQLVSGKGLTSVNAGVGDDLAKLLQLQPIYFDLDKSFIRPDAEVELQKVIIALQEYPQLKIDVRSHTDSRADDNYNMRLSERRAKSTMKYIIEKGGIAMDRISGRGYGESSLVNDCKNTINCSEEKHQRNRRSEFIILK